MEPSASCICIHRVPLGNAARATRTVSAGIGEPGAARRDIAHLLDRDGYKDTDHPGNQSILHPVSLVVSQEGSQRALGGVRQQSQCWTWSPSPSPHSRKL